MWAGPFLRQTPTAAMFHSSSGTRSEGQLGELGLNLNLMCFHERYTDVEISLDS